MSREKWTALAVFASALAVIPATRTLGLSDQWWLITGGAFLAYGFFQWRRMSAGTTSS